GLKGKIKQENSKRELLPDTAHLSNTHCARCLQPYRLLETPKRQCLDCSLFTCKGCGHTPEEQGWLCDPCHLARQVKRGSLEWYYGHVRARFKRFGGAQVVRSLCGRLQGAGLPDQVQSSPDVNTDGGVGGWMDGWSSPGGVRQASVAGGLEPGPGGRSGDSEKTDEDREQDTVAQAQPAGSKKKRVLPVHGLDFEADSDDSTPSCGPPPSLSLVSGAADNLQMMPGNPQDLDWKDPHSKELPFPSKTCQQAPCAQALTDEPCTEETTSQEPVVLDEADARASGCHPCPEGQMASLSPAGPDALAELCLPGESCTTAPGTTATPGRYLAGLLAHSDPALLTLFQQPGIINSHLPVRLRLSSDDGCATAVTLNDPGCQKMGLTVTFPGHITNGGLTFPSTAWEFGAPEVCPAGSKPTDADVEEVALRRRLEDLISHVCTAAGQTPSREKGPRAPQDPVQPSRTTDKELSQLEDRVAATASEVVTAPYLVRGKLGNYPKSQDKDDDSFDRKSVSRGSLTQRNPNGRKGTANHSFAGTSGWTSGVMALMPTEVHLADPSLAPRSLVFPAAREPGESTSFADGGVNFLERPRHFANTVLQRRETADL
ncbi:hypothetical protein E2I00_000760, partial [Balaenoptera physalus]